MAVNLWSRIMAGAIAFKEAFLASGMQNPMSEYTAWDARKFRYDLYWAFFENTAYNNVHGWATVYRQYQSLYRYIRGIYNPTYRLGGFWRSHIWGGRLDPEAGAGKDTPSAIPIDTKHEPLRPAIAQLWQWSIWQVNKNIASLYGSILGDVGLQIVDDTKRKKVYIQIVHPGIIEDVEIDPWGNVKGYKITEQRADPEREGSMVTYTETAKRSGNSVMYKTLRNKEPYAWNGVSGEWSMPYGFIPMVMIQHGNVGLDFGWSEIHAGRGKFQEVDDLASKLGDQIRKMVDAPWLFAGIDSPRTRPRVTGEAPTQDRAKPGKEEVPALYGPVGASATPLVAPLDISATTAYIMSLLSELEKDYPELQMDIWSAKGGDVSGRAMRQARQRIETKVVEIRPNYDDPLVRIQQMGVAIGGFHNYDKFSGFDLESYDKGELDHTIGEREIFAKDPLDDIELEDAFWKAAKSASDAGIPLLIWLERQGWTKEEIKLIEDSPEMQAKMQGLKTAALMAQNLDAENTEGGQPGDNGGQAPTKAPEKAPMEDENDTNKQA